MWLLFLLRVEVMVRLPEGIGGEFYTCFRSWGKNKTFFISFNHWESTSGIGADMTNV